MIPRLKEFLPKGYKTYFEPFVGGGAVFFALQPKRAVLSDSNSELVNTYRIVRDNPKKLLEALKKHKYEKDYYYQIREQDPKELSSVEAAARMIFLNRTGFNGLYRVNSKGKFNVPFGRYTNPKIVDSERIYACSEALQGTVIENFRFQEFPWAMVQAGDFVYFDPPYIPMSNTASFTTYDKGGFGEAEQRELAETYAMLSEKGAFLMLSNSGMPLTRELYKDFRIEEISMPRMINSKADKRGEVTEYLVLNY